MNKLRFTWILWGIILIVIIAALILMSTAKQKKIKPYKEAEETIESASKKYVEINGWYPEKGDKTKVIFSELIEKNLIKEVIIEEKNDKCDGYVLISNNGVIEYKAYMKCQNYQTHGYEED